MKKKWNRYIALTCIAGMALSVGCLSLLLPANRLLPVYSEKRTSSFSIDSPIELTKGKGSVTPKYSKIEVCRGENVERGVACLNNTGILFNADPISTLQSISISFDAESFHGATLYYGNHFYPTENAVSLKTDNQIEFDGDPSFFVIQAEADGIKLEKLSVTYLCDAPYVGYDLPQIHMDTQDENGIAHPINSRVDYTPSKVSVIHPDGLYKDLDSVSAGIRVRGNSTSAKPKRPYRIKFDKKQSLFGLKKNKSWALLADYMDASKMKNHMAFSFSKMLRGENEFTPQPNHVEVYLNGDYLGLYLLTENIDEKEGRMDLGVEDGYFTSLFDEDNRFDLNDFPLMYERDASAPGDPKSVLDETYCFLEFSNGTSAYYSLKYPEKEDFVMLGEDGKVLLDEEGNSLIDNEKYQLFFKEWKEYVRDIDERFIALAKKPDLSDVNEAVDLDSFVSYGLVDLFMNELDHIDKSAKFYKPIGSKLKAGPIWDYDACSLNIPFTGEPVDIPDWRKRMSDAMDVDYFGERYDRALYRTAQGKSLFNSYWGTIDETRKNQFLDSLSLESTRISEALRKDSARWHVNDALVQTNSIYVRAWAKARMDALDSWLR